MVVVTRESDASLSLELGLLLKVLVKGDSSLLTFVGGGGKGGSTVRHGGMRRRMKVMPKTGRRKGGGKHDKKCNGCVAKKQTNTKSE